MRKNTVLLHSFKSSVGFTLIELLVVISIIGILVSLSLVAFQATKKSARDGRRKADLEQIRSALEMCHSDTGNYPIGDITSLGISIVCGGDTYLAAVPQDPLDPTYSYQYYSDDGNTYTLCAYLETGVVATACTGLCGGACGAVACNYRTCNP